MNRFKNLLMWLVIILIVLLSILNVLITIYLTYEHEKSINNKVDYINSIIENKLKSIEDIKVINGENGKTPIKGIDYSDGLNGKDGTNGQNGIDGVNGKDGTNGKDAYFDIQCNIEKNRWEVKYSPTDKWKVLNGTPIRCTI